MATLEAFRYPPIPPKKRAGKAISPPGRVPNDSSPWRFRVRYSSAWGFSSIWMSSNGWSVMFLG